MDRDREWLLPAIVITTVTMVLAFALKVATGYPGHPSGMTSLEATIGVVVLAAFFRFLCHLARMWRADVAHPIAELRSDFRPALRSFAPIVAGVVIIVLFLYSITFLKSMITTLVPFWSDDLFAAMDRALFINSEALALALKPVLPAFGLYYGFWHAVHLGSILWVLHWRGGNKARHILSFMLSWTMGMSLAYLFASAGPLFTGAYDPAVAPPTVRLAAEFLWANYQAQGALIGGGISAFPSMHVALAAWFAIVLKDRGHPWIGVAYLLSIYFCSIVLGWHYAVDGAAGIAVTLVADRLAKRWLLPAGWRLGLATPGLALDRGRVA